MTRAAATGRGGVGGGVHIGDPLVPVQDGRQPRVEVAHQQLVPYRRVRRDVLRHDAAPFVAVLRSRKHPTGICPNAS
jgi:hypothetical protein